MTSDTYANDPTRVAYKMFRSGIKPWDTLCGEAAEFASQIPQEKLISVSHSQEGVIGVVIVWYRS